MNNSIKNKKAIVVVDDDDLLLKSLITLLKSEGFEVEGFLTGKEALKYLLEEKNIYTCSLLILDRLLPDMDGLDILRSLNAEIKEHCPVLILSLLSSDSDILSGLTKGAFDYITKPFNLEIFIEKVKKLMRK